MSPLVRRRSFLAALAASMFGIGLAGRGALRAAPSSGKARRVIVFYFPDGVPTPSGGPDNWFPTGQDASVTLSSTLASLAPYQKQCAFFRGLSMGPTDAGSHPGGAKKLLTGVDGGNGVSIDRFLASGVGKDTPFPHVYLGAMASQNNASGDKYISYPSAGTTSPPEDNPLVAFQKLFGNGGPVGAGGGAGAAGAAGMTAADPGELSVMDAVKGDLADLQGKLGAAEKAKLDLHMDALRDLEKRLKGEVKPITPAGDCSSPTVDAKGVDAGTLYQPELFPTILRAQTDVMVQAMACGLTRVGVIQASQHTSELIMSRFAGTDLYTPNYDMRSHQASHYGQPSDAKFPTYTLQRKWFVEQFAYLLGQLAKRPDVDGTMLDSSLVLLCTEVGDGNIHSHDDMPFILAGGGGGAVKTGRIFQTGGKRHGELLTAIARAMGDGVQSFGQDVQGPLSGLLSGLGPRADQPPCAGLGSPRRRSTRGAHEGSRTMRSP